MADYKEITIKNFCPFCNGNCRENCVFRQGEGCSIASDLGMIDTVYRSVETLTGIVQKLQDKKQSKEMRKFIETLEQYELYLSPDNTHSDEDPE